MKNKLDAKRLKEQLNNDDIINILELIGIPLYQDKGGELIFYTGDHNEVALDGSPKLYYYTDSRKFQCYTCGENYDIISLIQTRWELIGKDDFTFFDILSYILDNSHLQVDDVTFTRRPTKTFDINKMIRRYIKHEYNDVEIVPYDPMVVDYFPRVLPIEWVDEGISVESMLKYGIGYYSTECATTIPVWFEGELIGIRGRFWADTEHGKYRPIQILTRDIYKFPTQYMFYGWDYNIGAIKRHKRVILVEGEKSVLKSDTWYGDESIALGMFGKNLGKLRVKQLLTLGVNEVIIGIDSDYHLDNDEEFEKWQKSVLKIAEKLKGYFDVSVMFNTKYDTYQYSPFDYTKEQFEEMFIERERL